MVGSRDGVDGAQRLLQIPVQWKSAVAAEWEHKVIEDSPSGYNNGTFAGGRLLNWWMQR